VQPTVPASADAVVTLAGTNLYTLAEAAQILRCSTDTVMRRIASGKLRCFRDGRKVLFSENHINEYLESIETGVPSWGVSTAARGRRTTGRAGGMPRVESTGRQPGVVTAAELRRSSAGKKGRPPKASPSNEAPASST
jgi:excisionase family DNA binding protein